MALAQTPSLIAAFLVGLASTLHCTGMCGGIVGALTLCLPEPVRRSRGRMLAWLTAYNVGRLTSYAVAGALVAALGAGLAHGLAPGSGARVLRWLSALTLAGMGLNVGGWFPGFSRIEGLGAALWRRIEPLGRKVLPPRTWPQALAYGLVWGWLPCGLVYGMLVWSAASGGAGRGAALMAAFGLGTLPATFGAGFVARGLRSLARRRGVRHVAAVLMILIALLGMILPFPKCMIGLACLP